MRWLVIILLFCSCNPLRHYQKVANDPFRNAAERSLLSRAALQEFPAIRDSVRVVYEGVDSSDFNAVNKAYLEVLDTLIAHAEREDTVEKRGVLPISAPVDSLRVIRNFVKTYRPPPIIKTVTKEVPTTNGVLVNQLQSQLTYCRDENSALKIQTDTAIKQRQEKTKTLWWLIAMCAVLFGGNLVQLFGRGKLWR